MSVPASALLVTADFTGCRALPSLTPAAIDAALADALGRAGARIVRETSHCFPGQGVTSVVILAESHAALHTWPETGTVHLDLFTCSQTLDTRLVIERLKAVLAADGVEVREIERAVGSDPARRGGPVPSVRRVWGFVARAGAITLGLLAAWRLPWVELHLLTPFTAFQERLVAAGGATLNAVRVDLSCSGADTIAIMAGAILAWPARWRLRLPGVVFGLALIVAVNLLRIATLAEAAEAPRWFEALHVYVWPTVLTLAVAGYVFWWLSFVDRRTAPASRARTAGGTRGSTRIRFTWTTLASIAVFMAVSPLVIESGPVVALSVWMTGAAASGLGLLGATASAAGQVLTTGRGAFLVTGECVLTPLLPVGVAAALSLPRRWPLRLATLLAVGPLFVALGIVRLFVLALPSAVTASPEFWVHAFFQLVAAGVAVAAVALWRRGAGRDAVRLAAVRTATALAAGVAVAVVLGAPYTRVVQAAAVTLTGPGAPAVADSQGALHLLPPYQIGLFVALLLAWFGLLPRKRRSAAGLGLLVASQVLLFAVAASLDEPAALSIPLLRAWAVGLPVAVAALVASWPTARAGPGDGAADPAGYRRFWEGVGREFPDLGGAASTAYYLENEQRLLSEHLPPLAGITLLKTDLWDEAKNTRILQWAAGRGARVYGLDISQATACHARAAFAGTRLGVVTADCRRIPFADASFDAVYSMGTIEHAEDPELAVREMCRVLKPGGRAIVGVPNRFDPFLRPALAWALQRLGLYAYGAERSFSRRALRRMLRTAGFDVGAETAILFIPGWLRMLDLWCHVRCRPLTTLTRGLIAPFVWLDRHVPAVRRHGYLLASVAVKPVSRPGTTRGGR